jgi:hypothetical protein
MFKRKLPIIIILVTIVAVAGVFLVSGLPYARYHWSNVVSVKAAPYEGVGEPGCEIDIPEGSVVGQFVAATYLYWAPAFGGASTYMVEPTPAAPKTAWVIGQDASEKYYKIIWACQYLWVPKETMAPNPDEIWQSLPLPTRIVS